MGEINWGGNSRSTIPEKRYIITESELKDLGGDAYLMVTDPKFFSFEQYQYYETEKKKQIISEILKREFDDFDEWERLGLDLIRHRGQCCEGTVEIKGDVKDIKCSGGSGGSQ